MNKSKEFKERKSWNCIVFNERCHNPYDRIICFKVTHKKKRGLKNKKRVVEPSSSSDDGDDEVSQPSTSGRNSEVSIKFDLLKVNKIISNIKEWIN